MDPTDYPFKFVTKKVPILQGAEHPKIPWWPCLVLSPASGGTYFSILAHLQPPFSTEGSFPLPQLASSRDSRASLPPHPESPCVTLQGHGMSPGGCWISQCGLRLGQRTPCHEGSRGGSMSSSSGSYSQMEKELRAPSWTRWLLPTREIPGEPWQIFPALQCWG